MTELATTGHEQLRAFVERVERLTEDKQEIADEIKAVFAEAKANGYDTKAMRTIVKMRQQDTGERHEEETILQTYMHAMGMDLETPLHTAISAMATDKLARPEMIEALKQLAPDNGEIILSIGGPRVRIYRDPADGVVHAEEVAAEPKEAKERPGKVLHMRPATVLSIVPRAPKVPTVDDLKNELGRPEQPIRDPAPAEAETPSEEDPK